MERWKDLSWLMTSISFKYVFVLGMAAILLWTIFVLFNDGYIIQICVLFCVCRLYYCERSLSCSMTSILFKYVFVLCVSAISLWMTSECQEGMRTNDIDCAGIDKDRSSINELLNRYDCWQFRKIWAFGVVSIMHCILQEEHFDW